MTVYAKHSLGFEEGVEVFAFDTIPAAVTVLWEVDGGGRWDRLDGLWIASEEIDPMVVDDAGLLEEFGPVTDGEGSPRLVEVGQEPIWSEEKAA